MRLISEPLLFTCSAEVSGLRKCSYVAHVYSFPFFLDGAPLRAVLYGPLPFILFVGERGFQDRKNPCAGFPFPSLFEEKALFLTVL